MDGELNTLCRWVRAQNVVDWEGTLIQFKSDGAMYIKTAFLDQQKIFTQHIINIDITINQPNTSFESSLSHFNTNNKMASQKQFNQETNGAEVVASFPKSVADKTCEFILFPPTHEPALTFLVVITGPTPGGLGAQTALLLAASKPATIILLGRDESKAAPAVESVKAASPSTTVEFVHCDLGKYSSIKTAAESILATTPKIHTLINNAGVMAPAEYNTTAEGLEVQFGANHVGHFLLTNLLMPAIVAAASEGARIVNLSSMGWSLGEVRFDDYNFNDGKDYDKWSGYGQSKSANILFTVELAKRLKSKGVHAFAVHPGVIITNLVREMDPEKDYGTMTERFNSRGNSDSEFHHSRIVQVLLTIQLRTHKDGWHIPLEDLRSRHINNIGCGS